MTMDFGLTEEQDALVALMGQILGDRCTLERLAEVEAGAEWFDRELWAELAKADLLGLSLPEDLGGGGYGFLEACLLLEQLGQAVAPLPLQPTLVAALTIARFGTDEQRTAHLPGVAAGDAVLTSALSELDCDARDPQTTAVRHGDGWVITGMKTAVPAAHVASAMLVPATADDGELGVFVVDPRGDGVNLGRQDTFNHVPEFHVDLDRAPAELLGGDDAREGTVDWLVDRATVALCAVAAGVSARGLRLTADYSIERKQFDRQIATFQAVGQRMADTFIDNEAIRLTMLQAATKLDGEEPADKEVAVAKYWASYGGSRVGHAGLHVHGGISIDVDYPIHRYFLWSKQIEFTLGAGTQQLARLGDRLAAEPV
jgi:alkylation response protein AidB-like acyl-CoA dehydrogenase